MDPRFLIPAVIALVFGLARRYMSPAVAVSSEVERLASDLELQKRFARWQWSVGFLTLAVAGVLGCSLWWMLDTIHQGFLHSDDPTIFRVDPQRAVFFFAPFFGALTVAGEVSLWILKRVAGPDMARAYSLWTARKARFDSFRLLRWSAMLIGLPILLLTLPVLPTRVSIRDRDVRMVAYGELQGRQYGYDQIRRPAVAEGVTAPNGNYVERLCALLEFDDGRTWQSCGIWDDNLEPEQVARLVARLQTKTGLVVQRLHELP